MTEALTKTAFDAAAASERWCLTRLERGEPSLHDDPDVALAAFCEGFAPEYTLATFRSGVCFLRAGDTMPTGLGEPLHLEGVQGNETRILRHLGGQKWRCLRLTETDGKTHIAESIRWLGSGAAGEGDVTALEYRRYWLVEDDGGMRAEAARLTGVATGPSGGSGS